MKFDSKSKIITKLNQPDINLKTSNKLFSIGDYEKAPKHAYGFNSKEKRFQNKIINGISPPGFISLGPGFYETKSIFGYQKQAAQNIQWQPLNYIRLPNVPSIPSKNYKYGYEENESDQFI